MTALTSEGVIIELVRRKGRTTVRRSATKLGITTEESRSILESMVSRGLLSKAKDGVVYSYYLDGGCE